MPGAGRARGPKSSMQRNISESINLNKAVQRGLPEPTNRREPLTREISNSTSHGESTHGGTSESMPPSMQRVEAAAVTDNIAGSSSTKRVRGPTRGLGFAKKRKTDFSILIGDDSTNLINEIGITIRDHAPLNVRTWKQVPPEDKNKMWEMIRDKFHLEDDVEDAVLAQLNSNYRNYQSYLNRFHFKPHGSMERALQHCPRDMEEDRWRDVCETFNDEKFKKLSIINSSNRSKQKILHSAGSKGYHRLEYEMRDKKTNARPPMSLVWEKTHYNDKKDKWVNQAAKDVYDQVQAKIKTPLEDGTTPTEDEAFLEVLGPRSGYIRGRGAGPKPKSFMSHARQMEMNAERYREVSEGRREAEEARKEAEEARKENSTLREQLSQLDEKVQTLINLVQRGSN